MVSLWKAKWFLLVRRRLRQICVSPG